MNFSNGITKFLLALFACTSITAQQIQLNQQDEMIDGLIEYTINQLVRLDQITEHLARLISDHQITTLKDPQLSLAATTTTRSFLKEFITAEQGIYMLESARKITLVFELTRVAEAVCQHFEQTFKSHLTQLKPFGIEQYTIFMRLHPVNDSNITLLLARIKNLNTAILKLEKQTHTIGLTWYNKIARRIDDAIITPIQRNNLGAVLAVGTLSVLGAWFLIGEYGERLEKSMPEGSTARTIFNKIHTAWGRPIYRDNKNRPVDAQGKGITEEMLHDPQNNYTWRSKVADSAKSLMRDPLLAMTFSALGVVAYKAWDDIKSPISNFFTSFWNKLRGGAYLKAKQTGILNFYPTHGFDKVIGLETVKSEFDVLLQFLKDPEAAVRRGLIPSKAYLLTGAPGVGKTYAVEGLCGEIEKITQGSNHPFRFLRVDAPLIHGAPGGITSILEFARRNAPCVIFIDEIDLLGLQRTGDNKMLSEFLTSMGNSIDNDPMKLVVLIAATNKPQMLDKALLRTGRFKEIRIEHPTFQARKMFLEKELGSYGLNLKEFDLDAIAQETDQHTIEDLRLLIRRGIITSWMLKMPLNQAILDYGLNKEVHHIMLEDDRDIPVHEQKLLAVYFAGRAFALNIFDTNEVLAKVTIKPVMTKLNERTAWQEFFHKDLKEQATIEHGSVFTMPKRTNSINMLTKNELLDMCKAYLAGTAAQELLLNNSSLAQDNSDHERAFMCAQRYVLDGLDPEKLSPDLKKHYQHKAMIIFKKCKEEVKKTLKPHVTTIKALADKLEKELILSGNAVKEIISENEKS